MALHGDIRTVALDVDPLGELDVIADAHSLPFGDETFHAVVATAVLEHLIDPQRAMEEVHRVLVPGGLLYSEVPFMQQVHEGAYDFTRFTLSGHRRLARRFEELDSGAVAGPATALGWAIEHFALSVAGGGRRRTNAVKALVRTSLFWLKHVWTATWQGVRLRSTPLPARTSSGARELGNRRPMRASWPATPARKSPRPAELSNHVVEQPSVQLLDVVH